MARIIDAYSREAFAKIVAQSTSAFAVAVAMGYTRSSNSAYLVMERIEREGINIDHFKPKIPTGLSAKKSNEEIFCKGSKVSQNTLRNAYKSQKISPYECSICGLQPIWNGKPLTLTLDHINGDNRNNEISNLRWVCPNCDRQLPTFGSKNKRLFAHPDRNSKSLLTNPKYCIGCGCEINQGSIRCSNCEKRRLKPEKEIISWPQNDVLSWMVNNFSVHSVGKYLGVSDHAVKKRCLRRGIEIKKGWKPQYSGEPWPFT